MTRINLLPWREELRKERQQQFVAISVVAVVCSLVIVGIIHLFYANQISNQNARNNLLRGEIALLDKKIKEIENLEREKANLLARMNIIQQLQSARSEVVHVFDEVVTSIPDGVYLTKIENRNKAITLEGVAQSNGRVSSFMKNVESSEWLQAPGLQIIQAQEKKGQTASADHVNKFILKTAQISPKQESQAEPKKGK